MCGHVYDWCEEINGVNKCTDNIYGLNWHCSDPNTDVSIQCPNSDSDSHSGNGAAEAIVEESESSDRNVDNRM